MTRVAVDDELCWVVPQREAVLGASRAAGLAGFLELGAAFDAGHDTAFAARLVDEAAQAVAEYLADLPDLPYIGAPFGGKMGTD